MAYKEYGFFRMEPSRGSQDVLDALLETLDAGKSIVFEFGRYDDIRVYLLVANVITRRLRDAYEKKTTAFLKSQNEADRPRQLMITIEEAHKFLSPGIAHETPFGKIAREMRKFFVSLLVVDQRPSAIDEEVLSQIGTKIVAQLSDEKDISAALVGTSDASALRKVLASLDAKQQALVLGHAVPMPIVVRTRTYDEDFYRAMRDAAGPPAPESYDDAKKQMDNLFF
jgi:DNA helicase HerA-like ATPase